MGTGMSHMMGHSSISWSFVIIILFFCFLLVVHIFYTLWKERRDLHELSQKHSTLAHSVPMTLGMISTMTICTVVGTLMKNHLSASYIVGFVIGVLVSGLISLNFKDDIAVLDGVVSGVMGGIMGIMAGNVIPQTAMYTITSLLTVLFTLTWIVIRRRINSHLIKM